MSNNDKKKDQEKSEFEEIKIKLKEGLNKNQIDRNYLKVEKTDVKVEKIDVKAEETDVKEEKKEEIESNLEQKREATKDLKIEPLEMNEETNANSPLSQLESSNPTLKNIDEKDSNKIDKTEGKDSNEKPPSNPIDGQGNVKKMD